jgi:hypothetical protein
MPPSSPLTLRNYISVALLIAVMVNACATTQLSSRFGGDGSPSGAILQVTNSTIDDLQLFLVRSGSAIRIGTSPGLSTAIFMIPLSQLGDGGELQLRAGMRASPHSHRSGIFAATGGQRISWVIDSRVPSDVVIVR